MPSVQKFYSAHRVIKYPHVTEKSSSFGSLNKYAFVIYEKANKVQVKRAIEKLYGVRVLGVNVIHVPRKKRKLGRFTGWRGGYKKAVVTLREGHTIDLAQ